MTKSAKTRAGENVAVVPENVPLRTRHFFWHARAETPTQTSIYQKSALARNRPHLAVHYVGVVPNRPLGKDSGTVRPQPVPGGAALEGGHHRGTAG